MTNYSLERVFIRSAATLLTMAFFLAPSTARAQVAQVPATTPSLAEKITEPSPAQVKALDQEQRMIATRFSKLEELFIRMSELEAAENPIRAGLLQQAAQLSKQLATLQRLQSAADLLAKGQYSQAIKEQESTKEGMTKLLELLQSENRQSRIRDERERIEALIKDIQRIERLQRSLRGRTEGGQDKESAQRDQEDIRKQAETTEKGLTPENERSSQENDSKKDAEQSSDKQSDNQSDRKPEMQSAEQQKENAQEQEKAKGKEKETENDSNEDRKAKESQPTPSEKQPDSKSDKSSEGEPKPDTESTEKGDESKPKAEMPANSPPQDAPGQESPSAERNEGPGKPDQTESGESQQGTESKDSKQEKAPQKKPLTREESARKRLKQAQDEMQKAKESLEKEERDSATKRQQDAEEELRLAAEELEQILRQLREEEVERTLADLESRLKRMLQMQTRVAEQSKDTADTPRSSEDRTFEIQCSKLAIEERKIQMEGQKALLLLQDEGSSLAFPEAVEQVNRDIAVVADYFSNSRLDNSCMGLQAEIITALEEMIESLTETQRKMDEKKKKDANKKQGGQQGEEEEQPLVDKLAELRLIKTLQLRINTRTERLAKESGNAEDAQGNVNDQDVLKQLQDLSERQEKIKEVTRDIILEQKK